MITRNVAVRHAITAPITRTCLRTLMTDTTTSTSTPTHVSTPPVSPAPTGTPPIMPAASSPGSTSTHQQLLQARFGGTARAVPDTTVRDYMERLRLRKKTARLGASVERQYVPGDLIKNPPSPKDVTLELLLASQCHMGHHTSLWNAANARYIYGARQGIHIISLEQTAAYLRRAARVVEEVAYHGGLILFAGTRKGQADIVVRAAQLSRACHLFTKWAPGTITNRDQILGGGHVKVVDHLDTELPGFEKYLLERKVLVPDLVVCLNPLENFVMLRECTLSNIPTIGVIDTDADPTRVTYPIPANDDSLRAMAVICGILGRAGELGQRRRLADAQAGIVAWENPADVARFMQRVAGETSSELQSAMAKEMDEENALLKAQGVDPLSW